jgi:hypothetical protein
MSSQFQSNNPTSYLGILATDPGQNYIKQRAPLSTDYKGYRQGDRWWDETHLCVYGLVSRVGKVSTWIPMGGGTVSLGSLTPDGGGVVTPIALNIAITGDSAQGVTTYNAGAASLGITVQSATTALRGVINLATNAEAIAGADTAKAVTADDLKAKLGPQTAHGVMIGEGTAVAVASTGVGATGQVFIGNTGADPSWGQASLTASVSGILPVANGGTGVSSIPSFSAYKSANSAGVTGNGTAYVILCDTVDFNAGAAYNAGTGIFTAPVAGKYSLVGRVHISNCTVATSAYLHIVTTAGIYSNQYGRSVGTTADLYVQVAQICSMAAGDTAYLETKAVGEAGDTDLVVGNAAHETAFSGVWVGP